MQRYLVGVSILVLAVTVAVPGMAHARPVSSSDRVYFTETGHSLANAFLDYWRAHGDVAIFGYPLSEEFVDPNTGFTAQYFERAVFEWHPDAPNGWKVQLRRLGAEAVANRLTEAPFQRAAPHGQDNCIFFAQTGHNLCFGFRVYWDNHGGLPIFGYPLSEEFVENGHVVQYFERARFEWWPENAPPYDVLLGRLGAQAAAQNDVNMAATPTLEILAPEDGASLSLPATIQYQISGFPTGLPAGLQLRVQVAGLAEPVALDLPLAGVSGQAELPNDKRLPGRRDLTFQLVGSTGMPYTNPAAIVTVHNVTLLGGR